MILLCALPKAHCPQKTDLHQPPCIVSARNSNAACTNDRVHPPVLFRPTPPLFALLECCLHPCLLVVLDDVHSVHYQHTMCVSNAREDNRVHPTAPRTHTTGAPAAPTTYELGRAIGRSSHHPTPTHEVCACTSEVRHMSASADRVLCDL